VPRVANEAIYFKADLVF